MELRKEGGGRRSNGPTRGGLKVEPKRATDDEWRWMKEEEGVVWSIWRGD